MHFIYLLFNFVEVFYKIIYAIMKKNFPIQCPSCSGGLEVQSLHCSACGTTISGQYGVPALLRLKPEELEFVTNFIKCSGSLKQMASDMGLSYPTVRNLLDEIINNLKILEKDE